MNIDVKTGLIFALGILLSLSSIPARAAEILYDLGPDWYYGMQYPGTFVLTELPNAGVKIDINVPPNTGEQEGGLSGSEHSLPNLDFAVDNFVELHYNSYSISSSESDVPGVELEVEFLDGNNGYYEMGFTVKDFGAFLAFESWLTCEDCIPEFGESDDVIIPKGDIDVEQGIIGVARYGDRVIGYFYDKNNKLVFPVKALDASQLSGTHGFLVHINFDVDTGAVETAVATVVYEKVVYDVGGPPEPPPPPECDIQMSQSTYTDGETVIASVFRIANPADIEVATELKIWLELPGVAPVPITNAGSDGSLVLPAGMNVDYGPLPLFPVTGLPPGGYELSCRMFEPVTGKLIVEDRNFFSIEQPG